MRQQPKVLLGRDALRRFQPLCPVQPQQLKIDVSGCKLVQSCCYDLQAELEDAIYTYRELFRQDGIQLNYHSDQELYAEPISGDPQRLKQVFCNVLDNAAKHGGAGKRIDVDMTQEGDSYVVRIRDYGPGIPPAEVPFVKQKFYKGSSKARGSGIGLAVCDEIVQRHGGVFDIGNADGGGAIVTIRLPISGQEL